VSELDVLKGLESLRRTGSERVSRALHHEIGPALCSAGLIVGLLRSEADKLPPDGIEWLNTLQAAMESAMEATRLLSYRTDPGLAERCGFRSALEYLTRNTPLSFDNSQDVPDWPLAQSEAACRILRDVIPAIGEGPGSLKTSTTGFVLYGSGKLNLDRRQRTALRSVARANRIALLYEVPTAKTLFSLRLIKAN
jgi:hypothetical protein